MVFFIQGLLDMARRCPVCLGSKQLLTLGNMVKDCHECDGVGFVSDESEEKQEPKKVSIKERRQAIIKDTQELNKWKK